MFFKELMKRVSTEEFQCLIVPTYLVKQTLYVVRCLKLLGRVLEIINEEQFRATLCLIKAYLTIYAGTFLYNMSIMVGCPVLRSKFTLLF